MDYLMQNCDISIALTREILLFCTKPLGHMSEEQR